MHSTSTTSSVNCWRPFGALRPCRRLFLQPARASQEQQQQSGPCIVTSCTGRRQLLLNTSLLAAVPLFPGYAALAEEGGNIAQQAFFEVNVDGKPAGRFVVELFPDAGIAAQRFADLAEGKEGVAFRRSRFELLEDTFIQDSGVKVLSRRADGRTPITGGPDTELLEEQLAAGSSRQHDAPGLVSLAVLPRKEIVTKDKLVAVNGQLVSVTETFGEVPNGTAWAVTTAASPELDATNIVVGRVVEGMDVVMSIAALPRVKDNRNSPFFQAGKAAGDKRADVAERAFKKPYAKIIIERCGLS